MWERMTDNCMNFCSESLLAWRYHHHACQESICSISFSIELNSSNILDLGDITHALASTCTSINLVYKRQPLYFSTAHAGGGAWEQG